MRILTKREKERGARFLEGWVNADQMTLHACEFTFWRLGGKVPARVLLVLTLRDAFT